VFLEHPSKTRPWGYVHRSVLHQSGEGILVVPLGQGVGVVVAEAIGIAPPKGRTMVHGVHQKVCPLVRLVGLQIGRAILQYGLILGECDLWVTWAPVSSVHCQQLQMEAK